MDYFMIAYEPERNLKNRFFSDFFTKQSGISKTEIPLRGYSVAAMTALMVCIRFSASSNTMD